MDPVRVFAVGDAGYFVGVVALVNSLRITGNHVPVTLLDLGFSTGQRDLLAAVCDIVDAPRGRHPHLTKTFAPMHSDADVVVLIDADVLVTASLDPLIADAQAGFISATGDPQRERFFEEWSDIFALRAPLRREVYVNSGVVAFSQTHFPDLLERWAFACDRLTDHPVLSEADENDPRWLADQDALNALLMSEVPPGSVAERFDMMMGRQLHETRFTDLRRLACERRGALVRFLHTLGSPKPWQPRARWEFRSNAFVIGLRRVLSGPDLEIEVPRAAVPPWLRSGWKGRAARAALRAYDAPASRSRPLRQKVGLSPWRKQEGYQPGRK